MGISELLSERFKGNYVSQAGLRSLADYGYHGEDRSFFGNLVLKHWWNWVVELVPLWFAPNLLTLLGLFCNMVAYALMVGYCWHLTEAVPRWVYFVNAFLIFMYQTLDNVDGKQARRTGSSSPLGELFDHGCDSITMGMIGLIVGGTGRIGGEMTLIALIVTWWPFYLAHWEEYHTGILIMGKFNGPTEAQLIAMAMLVFTGIIGPHVWLTHIFTINNTAILLHHILWVFIIVFSLITLAQNVYKVLTLPTRVMPLVPTVLQLSPLFVLSVATAVWGATEYALVMDYPHIVLGALSLVFAYITSRLIVNRVCKEPSQRFHGILIPTIIVALAGIIDAIRKSHGSALVLAYIFLILAFIQFLFFSVCIIRQLTTHLGIRAFKIIPVDPSRPRPPPPQQTGVASPLLEQQNSSTSSSSSDIHAESEPGAHSIE